MKMRMAEERDLFRLLELSDDKVTFIPDEELQEYINLQTLPGILYSFKGLLINGAFNEEHEGSDIWGFTLPLS